MYTANENRTKSSFPALQSYMHNSRSILLLDQARLQQPVGVCFDS